MRSQVDTKLHRENMKGVLAGPVVVPIAFCTSLNALCIFCQVGIFCCKYDFCQENLWKYFI